MRTSNYSPFALRLADLLAGYNVAAFARNWNIPGGQVMIYQHIRGLKPISLAAALGYAKAFNLSLFEIIPEFTEQLRNVRIFPDEDVQTKDRRRMSVPQGQLRCQAGQAGFEFDAEPDPPGMFSFADASARERCLRVGNLYAITVKGKEMEPTFAEGSTVIINTSNTRRKDGGVFAINRGGEVVLRRLVKQSGVYVLFCDNVELRGESPQFFDEHCRVIGRVIFQYGEVP